MCFDFDPDEEEVDLPTITSLRWYLGGPGALELYHLSERGNGQHTLTCYTRTRTARNRQTDLHLMELLLFVGMQ